MPAIKPLTTKKTVAIVKPARNLKKRTAKPSRVLKRTIVKK